MFIGLDLKVEHKKKTSEYFLLYQLGIIKQPDIDRSYHNRSKVDTHADGYVTI